MPNNRHAKYLAASDSLRSCGQSEDGCSMCSQRVIAAAQRLYLSFFVRRLSNTREQFQSKQVCRTKKTKETNMPKTRKSIVFCHGLWADGSCFSKLIIPLQAEGYECIATQHGLNTTAEDVAVTKETIGRVSNPVILVGHSYGGSVITGAGTDDRVTGLVYVAALAPDADETSQTQQSKFPKTDVFSHIEVVDGRIWL